MLREDPGYARADPRGDVYIETRVQRRLGPRWGGLLPVVAVLRRFDRAMLGCAVDQADLEDAWHELHATEWTSASPDRSTQSMFAAIRLSRSGELSATLKRAACRTRFADCAAHSTARVSSWFTARASHVARRSVTAVHRASA